MIDIPIIYDYDNKEQLIDDHIKIKMNHMEGMNIYIDDIKVFNAHMYDEFYYMKAEYYYKIPRKATKKINKWIITQVKQYENEIKDKKQKEINKKINEKKDIEKHFKGLYK